MALATQICLTSECLGYLGIESSVTDADRALMTMLRQMVENQARRFVRHGISQPSSSYVEFHPRFQQTLDGPEIADISGGKLVYSRAGDGLDILALANGFVRSVTSVYEDYGAYFGQGSGDFAAATLLTQGTDYAIEADEQDSTPTYLSRAGNLVRISGSWSTKPGTIKVTYMAGFTAAELDGPYSDIKLAIIEEACNRFKLAKSKEGNGGAPGPIKSEMIGGQWSVTYDTSVQSISKRQLSDDCKEALEPYMRLSLTV